MGASRNGITLIHSLRWKPGVVIPIPPLFLSDNFHHPPLSHLTPLPHTLIQEENTMVCSTTKSSKKPIKKTMDISKMTLKQRNRWMDGIKKKVIARVHKDKLEKMLLDNPSIKNDRVPDWLPDCSGNPVILGGDRIVLTPMNENPGTLNMWFSRNDYIIESELFMKGGACWDEDKFRKATPNMIFAFVFYQKGVDRMELFRIQEIREDIRERRDHWCISEHETRRVIVLSSFLGTASFKEFGRLSGYKDDHLNVRGTQTFVLPDGFKYYTYSS